MPDAAAWNHRYESGWTPWDLGRAHPELVHRLDRDPTLGTGTVGRVVVPGAGNGHDAEALAVAGWSVTAVDLAAAVEGRLARIVEPHGGRVVIADVLEFEEAEPFDLIFDHTFFCAIEPLRRPEFGSMCRRVVAPGGSVVSIVFPIGRPSRQGGPPWGVDADAVSASLSDGFRLTELAEPSTVPGRGWPHRWGRWMSDG